MAAAAGVAVGAPGGGIVWNMTGDGKTPGRARLATTGAAGASPAGCGNMTGDALAQKRAMAKG